MSLDETYLNPPTTPKDIEETMAAAKSRAGSCPTPEEIVEILSEVSSTRWPIAVSLVDGGQTATELAKAVGKSVSWTLKQAKQMQADGILKSDPDPLNQSRGLVYTLKDGVREVLERRDEYAATVQSLKPPPAAPSFASRVGQIVSGGIEGMGDADAVALEYGFMPVSVRRIGTGDESEQKYQLVEEGGEVMAVGTLQKFIEVMRQLESAGAPAAPLRTQPQANPSE